MCDVILTSANGDYTVRVQARFNPETLCVSAAPDVLVGFISKHWAHNGAFGIEETFQAWVPVHCSDSPSTLRWLHADSLIEPKLFRLVSENVMKEGLHAPPDELAFFVRGAEFLHDFVGEYWNKNLSKLKAEQPLDRVLMQKDYLFGTRPWGTLYCSLDENLESKNPFVAVEMMDGSILYLTKSGPTLKCPISPTAWWQGMMADQEGWQKIMAALNPSNLPQA